MKEYNSAESSDYANLMWDMGCIYLQVGNRSKAVARFKTALEIYTELWANEPELINAKAAELKSMAKVYGMNTQNLITAI